ncbi:hypothetical protein [Serratia marcescens]|uniref:hypothetical protein n=1 Tax=Serratia marcescens TaxID=615 RepID=UPI000A8BBF65|nr:hypothetical protein [Serratia marcescens]
MNNVIMIKYIITISLLFSQFAFSAEYKISIPTDAKAVYTVLGKGEHDGLKTIITKREGSSGVSYSERAYDCVNRTVKYLGDGETLEQMKSSRADPNMSDIVPESIADYVGNEACK